MSSLTYKPFPTEALPTTLQIFVREAAPAIGCDEAALALPALCAAAGILGNSRRLKIKSTWQVPPILWGCLLGESGSSKSPALRLALAPLREKWLHASSLYNQKSVETSRQSDQEWLHASSPYISPHNQKWLHASSLYPPASSQPPPPRRILVADATTEALAEIASQNPHGLLLARDELAGFLGNLDRYGAQSGADEAFFLSAFDGDPTTVDRKTLREPLFIPAMTLSIIGTCQPAVFQTLMTDQRRASGLLARFLLIEPPTPPKRWRTNNLNPQILADWSTTLTNLLDLGFANQTISGATAGFIQQCGLQNDKAAQKPNDQVTPWPITVTPEAEELYRKFYNTHNEQTEKQSGDRRALLSKAEQLPLRLALILHHLTWADPSELVGSVSQSDPASVPSPPCTHGGEGQGEGVPSNSANATLANPQSDTHFVPSPPIVLVGGEGQGEGVFGNSVNAWSSITADTMQHAITLANWFTAETLRVYELLAMSPEERLALELETWIASQGGKTSLEKIMKGAPEKFRQSEADARALLKILSTKKRGHWATMVILPINLSAAAASHPPTRPHFNEFHLKPKTRAA